MNIVTTPNHPTPMFVSAPTEALPSKLVKDTIYMPSSVAALVLGGKGTPEARSGEQATPRETRHQ